jgi:Amt family ammonium transporter
MSSPSTVSLECGAFSSTESSVPTTSSVLTVSTAIYKQIAYIVAVTAYSFVVSAILAFAIDKIPGLKLRASEEAELLGMDDDQLGEFAYDYVEVRRDYLAWTPAKGEPIDGEHSVPQGERHGIPQHSQMLEGKAPSEHSSGHEHTGIAGDRHAMAMGSEHEKQVQT